MGSKKILCLGNNTVDTDTQARRIAEKDLIKFFGCINSSDAVQPGYYHSSLYDVEIGILLDIIKQFDQIIILDQTYHDPDVFLKTVELGIQAESFVKVIWNNESHRTNSLFFKELVEKNKSFCILPFIELLVQNGFTTVCCRSNTPITQIDKLINWQNDHHYKVIREKMLAGILLPKHCHQCYDYESKGLPSPRKIETLNWSNRLGIRSLADMNRISTPSYYEIRASNTCNLQCRSCSPENSNLIEKEYIKLGWHDSSQVYDYTNFDFVDFTNLKSLYIAGGEPTAMPELYVFLEKCIKENKVNFDFTINTNAVKLNNKFKSLINKFSNLQFIVSIDGYKDTNHYVRWPTDWKTLIDNVRYLIDNNHKIIFQTVVSIWTIPKLHELFDFIDNEFPNVPINCLLATSENNIFDPFNFPDKDLVKNNIKKIRHLNCYKNNFVFSQFIDGLMENFQKQSTINKQKLKEFFEFNDKLDHSRNIRLKDYIPELEECRKYVLK